MTSCVESYTGRFLVFLLSMVEIVETEVAELPVTNAVLTLALSRWHGDGARGPILDEKRN